MKVGVSSAQILMVPASRRPAPPHTHTNTHEHEHRGRKAALDLRKTEGRRVHNPPSPLLPWAACRSTAGRSQGPAQNHPSRPSRAPPHQTLGLVVQKLLHLPSGLLQGGLIWRVAPRQDRKAGVANGGGSQGEGGGGVRLSRARAQQASGAAQGAPTPRTPSARAPSRPATPAHLHQRQTGDNPGGNGGGRGAGGPPTCGG